MVNLTDTLARLNKEKDYEDELVYNLMTFFISSIDEISDIDDNNGKVIKQMLSQIVSDSKRHSQMFSMLIEMVIKNGNNNY